MSVFTIYCHGTGGHRDKPDKEIVTFLGRGAFGEEYKNYLILDGVGGTPKGKTNPMAGTFNWADRNKAPKGKTPLEQGGGSVTKTAMVASATGAGVEDNARHAIVAIANLPELPDTVNMIGWSRGAVTALVIANMLYDPSSTEGLFRSINVNIFAIDPVAGADAGVGKDSESRRLIPSNVKNYLGILATGENRNTFKPQDLARVHISDLNSNVMFLPFPGKHSSSPQNNDPKTLEVSQISWSLAVQFLKFFGTRCDRPMHLFSLQDYLEKYSYVLTHHEQYAKVKQKGLKQRLIGLGFGKRDMTQHMSDYVRYPEYFINEHHRACFDFLFPALSRWLLSPASGNMNAEKTAAMDEIKNQRDVSPEFMKTLPKLGITFDAAKKAQLPPAGCLFEQTALTDSQAKGSLLRMGVVI
jgi:hypothetical protein